MTLLTGLTADGTEVPVQVLPDGTLVAEGLEGPPGPSGDDNWTRTGTELSPTNSGDDVFTSGDVKVGGTTAVPKISLIGTNGSATFTAKVLIPAEPVSGSASGVAIDEAGQVRVSQSGSNEVFVVYQTGSSTKRIILSSDGTAAKTGGGSWAATSDIRVKETVIDYSTGLPELKQLQPRSYRYIGNEQTYIGLVAQEAEGAMPELVTQEKGTLPDGTEVDDFRTLDMTPLTFALINAVKELATRLEAIEQKS